MEGKLSFLILLLFFSYCMLLVLKSTSSSGKRSWRRRSTSVLSILSTAAADKISLTVWRGTKFSRKKPKKRASRSTPRDRWLFYLNFYAYHLEVLYIVSALRNTMVTQNFEFASFYNCFKTFFHLSFVLSHEESDVSYCYLWSILDRDVYHSKSCLDC